MSTLNQRLTVRPVRAFADNYIWLIQAPQAPERVVVVDPGDASPVLTELERRGASLAAILLTHHHADHIGGVARLLERASVPVVAPHDVRIPLVTRRVAGGERCEFADLGLAFDILAVPGHTLSHIAFFGHGALFCGDTLFSAGCGRLFEGTPQQMNTSLDRLRALPPDTRMYCGHEYTAANLRFATAVEPDNLAAREHGLEVERLRAADEPSLPSLMSLETRMNPFLRCDDPHIRTAVEGHVGKPLESTVEVFAALRAWKDEFR